MDLDRLPRFQDQLDQLEEFRDRYLRHVPVLPWRVVGYNMRVRGERRVSGLFEKSTGVGEGIWAVFVA